MKESDWIILNELYKEPNLTKVSEKLYYSQPTITKTIRNLEEEFDVRILLRSSKGVKFTPEGEFLAKKSIEYLKFMHEVRDEIKSFKYNIKGFLNLGSSYTYSKYFLPEILYDYSRDNNVNFNIVTKQSEELFRDISNLDGAFIHGEYDGNIESILVDKEKAYILASDAIDINNLIDENMITYKTNDKTTEMINSWWYKNYDKKPSKGFFAGYVDVAWQLVAKKLGYVCCFLSDNFINEYDLAMYPMMGEDGKQMERNTYFIYNKNSEKSSLFEDFLEYLKTNYAKDAK